MKKDKKIDAKQSELAKQIGFAELVSELGDAVDRYYPEALFLRAKTIITPFMFENKEDYEYFISKLEEFFQSFHLLLGNNIKTKTTNNMSSDVNHYKTLGIIRDLIEKFPEQFSKFVLSHVFIERGSPYIIKACLDFLKDKNVYVEILTQDLNGYKYTEIVSTDELDADFLRKQPSARRDIGDRLRNLTKEEYEFLTSATIMSAIDFLEPQDFAYCAKKPQYAGALYYNLNSYFNYITKKNPEEIDDSVLTLVKSNFQYLNLNKLKILMVSRILSFAEKFGINNKDYNIEHLEKLTKSLLEILKNSKATKISDNDFFIDIIDEKKIKFSLIEQRRENTVRTNPKLVVFSPDSSLEKITFKLNLKFDITTRDAITDAELFLEKIRFNRFLDGFDEGKLEGFDFNLKNTEIINILRKVIYTRVVQENPDSNKEQIEELCFSYAKKLIEGLYEKQYVSIAELRRFDEAVVCELIAENKIQISDNDLSKNGFSKQAIAYLCCVQPNRIISCLDKKYITKNDLLSIVHIPNSIIVTLFNERKLSINEILDLVSQKKVVLNQLVECEFNSEILKEEIDPIVFANLYINIINKKIDYETQTQAYIEQCIEKGIPEEEIPTMENDQEFQLEIQSLVKQKNAYIILMELSQIKGKEKDDFYETLVTELFTNLEYQEFCRVAGEMYQDEIIDMDFIRRIEPDVIVELIKSFIIKTEDLEKFKMTAVSEEEIAELKEICDSDEEFQKEFDELRYKRLEEIVNSIVKDSSISQEEKIGIIYNIYSLNTDIENRYVEYYENAILTGEFETEFEKIYNTYKDSEPIRKKRKHSHGTGGEKIDENKFVYPARMIWEFMRLLDPNVSIKVYRDGNVVFCSEKLNKVMIESIWNGSGDGIKRSYGSATISMDLSDFNKNESQIIVPGRKGYRIDTLATKDILPTIKTNKGEKKLGLIRHNKDLNHTGKKIWFELLLDNFGINLDDIRNDRDSKYAPEDADKIEQFIENARDSYERV